MIVLRDQIDVDSLREETLAFGNAIVDGRGTGAVKDPYDVRDWIFEPEVRGDLPRLASCLSTMPDPEDQENWGACTAFGAVEQWAQLLRRLGLSVPFDPSYMATWAWTKYRDGGIANVAQDVGSSGSSATKSLIERGVAPVDLFPYDMSTFGRLPEQAVVDAAEPNQLLEYYRIPNTGDREALRTAIKASLAQRYAVGFSIALHSNFRPDYETGRIPSPSGSILGYHRMVIYGYEDLKASIDWFGIRNSWGSGWGGKTVRRRGTPYRQLQGSALMEQDHILDHGFDFLTYRRTEGGSRSDSVARLGDLPSAS